MSTTVKRAVLGFLSALTTVGGALVLVESITYFGLGGVHGNGRDAPELSDVGIWGVLAGMVAVLIFVAGALPIPIARRIAVGGVVAGSSRYVTEGIASLVAEAVDVTAGSNEAHLEDGVVGGIWCLAGAFIVWSVVSGRWPLAQPAVYQE